MIIISIIHINMRTNIIVLFSLLFILEINLNNCEEQDEFVPSNEWQVIKDGQTIPKGLHVRINLQTGLKEAKLMDPDESKGSKQALSKIKDDEFESNFLPKDVKSRLRKIKNEDLEADAAKIKGKFKNYDQLKKELSDLNLSVKSDNELLTELINKYKNVSANNSLNLNEKNEEILIIFKDIEYLIHQIDNAYDFVRKEGIIEIIYEILNSTDLELKSETLLILGSCVQNNAKVQIYALETGALEIILRILALENNYEIKLRAIYALSCLLRRFPLAQLSFIKKGGINMFANIFKKPENIKIQLKIVTLLYDLLIEQNEASEDKNNIDFKEKSKQYKSINLKSNLVENDWCDILNNMLINNLFIEGFDHDSIERCLNIISLIAEDCLANYSNSKLLNILQGLKLTYENLSEIDENDSYFTNLKNLTHNLVNILKKHKTEL